ncbi:GtrA family protein [Streptomyces sp. NPDC092370]|uniref:GtrA family protein n=1 Tax=Streptomyces sp. NPDC092370 TaxID=3366016 RepID=UPI00381DC7FB
MTVNLAEERVAAPALPVKRVILEVADFAPVGGSGVAVNVPVSNVPLHGLHRSAMVATVRAGLVARGGKHLGFRYVTSRDRASRTRRRIGLFFVFGALGVALDSGLFHAGFHGLGLDGPLESHAVKAVPIVLASAFLFLVHRARVFQHDARRA